MIFYDSARTKRERREKRCALGPYFMVERVSADILGPDHLYTVPLGSDGVLPGSSSQTVVLTLPLEGTRAPRGLLNLTNLWRLVGNTQSAWEGRRREGADSLRLAVSGRHCVVPSLRAARDSAHYYRKHTSFVLSPLKTFDAPSEEKPTAAKLDGEHAAGSPVTGRWRAESERPERASWRRAQFCAAEQGVKALAGPLQAIPEMDFEPSPAEPLGNVERSLRAPAELLPDARSYMPAAYEEFGMAARLRAARTLTRSPSGSSPLRELLARLFRVQPHLDICFLQPVSFAMEAERPEHPLCSRCPRAPRRRRAAAAPTSWKQPAPERTKPSR